MDTCKNKQKNNYYHNTKTLASITTHMCSTCTCKYTCVHVITCILIITSRKITHLVPYLKIIIEIYKIQ